MSEETDPGPVLTALVARHVRFVVITGQVAPGVAIAPARHPANLEALGRALDDLEGQLQEDAARAVDDPAFGPAGRLSLMTSAGPLTVFFGPAQPALYAQVLEESVEEELAGIMVRTAPFPAEVHDDRDRRTPGQVQADRLVAIVDHVWERHPSNPDIAGNEGPLDPS